MSDYLSHLVARHHRSGEGVRPRAGAYFAPESQPVDPREARLPGLAADSEARALATPTVAGPARAPREAWNAVGRALVEPSARAAPPSVPGWSPPQPQAALASTPAPRLASPHDTLGSRPDVSRELAPGDSARPASEGPPGVLPSAIEPPTQGAGPQSLRVRSNESNGRLAAGPPSELTPQRLAPIAVREPRPLSPAANREQPSGPLSRDANPARPTGLPSPAERAEPHAGPASTETHPRHEPGTPTLSARIQPSHRSEAPSWEPMSHEAARVLEAPPLNATGRTGRASPQVREHIATSTPLTPRGSQDTSLAELARGLSASLARPQDTAGIPGRNASPPAIAPPGSRATPPSDDRAPDEPLALSAVSRARALGRALEATPAPASSAAEVTRSEPPPSATRAPDTEPPAAPTIQITIGRIEVRAMTPAAPARSAPARAAPAPSLADYLARRNGGGR